MTSIVLFGAGNLATHLFKRLSVSEKFRVVQVYNHRESSLKYFEKKTSITSNLNDLISADIYLFAIRDEAIPGLAVRLKDRGQLMLHTSGATSIDVFNDFSRRGVLYPVQTFSKAKEINFRKVPLCVEAGDPEDLKLLEKMASEISDRIYRVSSTQRKALHVAAVFANNFVNHLYSEAKTICDENELPFEVLKPLIKETADKVMLIKPEEAQTGPAKRNDLSVINSHLELLSDQQQKLYKTLTQSIQDRHGKEL